MVIHKNGLSYSVINEHDVKVSGFYPRNEEKSRIAIPPHVDGYRVAEVGKKAFFECSHLRHVILPPSVHSVGDEAFGLCSNLEDIVLPDSIKRIGKGAFEGTTALKEVTLPPHIETLPKGLFYDSGIAKVSIPEHITEIPSGCFYDCRNLQRLALPAKITKVAADAFHYCVNLKEVVSPSVVDHIEMFNGEKEWLLKTTPRVFRYRVVEDGNVSYTDDYEEAVRGFSWSIAMAREGLNPHGFTCEIFDNTTGELMHREEYKGF